ncbi:hypothetical protein [Pseudomonas oryzihabitans]|nr:hypothetical protein [Pseudomonas oryzihabitans]MDT3720158.1 hypothetical protein [Pseudomonas oryzihabitans]
MQELTAKAKAARLSQGLVFEGPMLMRVSQAAGRRTGPIPAA